MTELVSNSADREAAAPVILAKGDMSLMREGRFVDAFECTTFPPVSKEAPEVAIAAIGDLQDLRNTQGSFDVYNFEVEQYHTYVAGGIRVHNTSGWLGKAANFVEEAIDGFAELLGAKPGGAFDNFTNDLFAPVHALGRLLTGASELAINAAKAVGGWIGEKLTQFDAWLGDLFGVSPQQETTPVSIPEGTSYREDGAVATWNGGVTNPNSYYSKDFLDRYGHVTEQGVARATLGNHFRALGDYLGITDGEWGLQGGNKPSKKPIRPKLRPDDLGKDNDKGGGWGRSRAEVEAATDRARSGVDSVGDTTRGEDREHPIILDLDGMGVEITELSNSTVFVDATGDGLRNLTAWAAAGNGVLFYDADGDGTISEKREYVFTEWDPTATSDIEALKAIFDSNGDGVFDANDDAWSDFKVLVTQADGSLVAKTLDELGITSIDLTADATNIELPDGSVITGKTTFTYSDGTTGTVADTTLVSETASYRVEESEVIDSEGVRTHIQTGYGADGAISFVITSVTTADGSSITNSYDDNGDGVVDRVQTIFTVTNVDGSKSETVTNKVGADFSNGILVNETKTTTSADGAVVTIERDSTGGGWYDQTEVRTTHADDSLTIVTTDRGPDGSVIRSSSETVSADGLVRTDAIDEDGDGSVDLTITHTIVINADGSRSETIQYFNADGSLRSSVTETVSADGQTKTIARDQDGDGDIDVQEELNITVNADGSTVSSLLMKNGDGSLRSSSTHTQSDDALQKTSATDQDGDGDVDVTMVEATTIHADDSRETETTQTNTDGSVRGKTKVTLGSDKVSSETWIDHNQDDVFQATDLSRSVTVDGTTGERTTTSWTRNADGSYSAHSVSVASEDGLDVTTSFDTDGDGDTDLIVEDITVENADGTSTRTVTERASNGSLISEQEIITSASGLTVTTLTDLDGDGSIDSKTVSVSTPNADGSVTQTQTVYAGDQTTVLSETTVIQSADRRVSDTAIDANGDGSTDTALHSEKHADGSMTETETRLNADGETLYRQQTDTSADGLTVTVATDLDGNDVVETKTVQNTVLNADGGRTTTTTVHNGDDSLRSRTVTTVSDDGLVVTTSEDTDGDGTADVIVTSTTQLQVDGSQETTEDLSAGDNALLSRTTTIVSDDGLTVETRSDNDGDGSADIASTSTTVLHDDGSTTVTSDVRDVSGGGNILRSQSITTTSDDGRDVLVTTDIDGDGDVDVRVHRVVGDDGQVTRTETELNSDGSIMSQSTTTTNDNGLEISTRHDADGNGGDERTVSDITVLNADGSTTMTVAQSAEDGTVYSRTVVETSADEWTTTTREDWDNDGDDDLTTLQTYDLATDGVETTTVTQTAADGSTLNTSVTEVSADKRTTTQSLDVDGNGIDDMVSVSHTDDSGLTTTNTTYYSAGGGIEAQTTSTVSGDGLTTTMEVDRNGDGEAERIVKDTTTLSGNGSSTRTVNHSNGRNVSLGEEVYHTSDDGLRTSVQLDLDGNGLFDYTTKGETLLESNGEVVNLQATLDEKFQTQSEIKTVTSGDGLRTTVETDFSGDGSPNRISLRVAEANGAFTETVSEFGAGTDLQNAHVRTVSADGRTEIITSDLDGDGFDDRTTVSVVDADRVVTTTISELTKDSRVETEIVETTSANGMHHALDLDIEGDGSVDITRSTDVSYDAQGNRITTFTETGENGEITYQETRTVSADGLVATSSFDLDGDGELDGTKRSETVLNPDGSQVTTDTIKYANGDLRSEKTVSVSSDGRTVVQTEDFDGNGIADKVTEVVIRSDGEQVVTERAFNEAGYATNIFVTTTSSDGLTQTILRNGNEQTITRSAVDNGTYTWNNGVSASVSNTSVVVSHEVDALGVETWTSVAKWKNSSGTILTQTESARVDQAAKARVLEEAARIYDTVLDRDADFTELETLVAFIEDGQLDKAALTSALIGSAEFQTRYGTLTNAEFITQIFLNAYGRAPALSELKVTLSDLFEGRITRGELAAEISESAEHIVVGNGHRATNNFDVILNPAQFERGLDRAYAENLIKSLVDVVYDRDATDQEIAVLSKRLLKDTDNPDDIAADLLALEGSIQGVATNSLNGLNGAKFIEQAFMNALGRPPTTGELALWSSNLDNGRITKAQFVASLAQSVEYQNIGNAHVAPAVDPVVTKDGTFAGQTLTGANDQNDALNGHAGDDTLEGKGGSDVLTGGIGNDHLYGGSGSYVSNNGNDTYVWSRGDGNDWLADNASSLIETDRLILADVTSDDVSLVRVNGSEHLKVIVPGTSGDEVIEIARRFQDISKGYGVEVIKFADGVIWALDDILANTKVEGTSADNTLTGTGYADNLFGLEGNDRLDGKGGDDVLEGGVGNDHLYGGSGSYVSNNGNDTYVWSRGDGNDWLADNASSLIETDRLILADVTSDDVSLVRVNGSEHLKVIVPGTSGDEVIEIARRFQDISKGYGVEVIEFADGVIWALDDILANTKVEGTSADNTLTGTGYADNLFGLEGNDRLDGKGGDDVLEGGVGNDHLYGGSGSYVSNNGNDTYIWSRGDGNDWLADNASSKTEIDRLVLTDVTSDDVSLVRVNGSEHLKVIVPGTSGDEIIEVARRFQDISKGYGVEVIEFADGVIWALDDILANTKVEGTSANNTLTGTGFADNLFGLSGGDTLDAGAGDDTLVGGNGNDILKGGNGHDLYLWSSGDGNDTINDTSTSTTEVDTLRMVDLTSDEVELSQVSFDLKIDIAMTGETILVQNRFRSSSQGNGIEFIEFSDGVTVEVLESEVAETIVTGTIGANILNGWGFKDTIYGFEGADTIEGKAGDDVLIGGEGDDTLRGGSTTYQGTNGSDTYIWSRGDGNDWLADNASSLTEIDRLILTDVTLDDVRLVRDNGSEHLKVIVSGANGEETIEVARRFENTAKGYGIEVIEFGDGEIWALDDILANTTVTGGDGNNTFSGTSYADNLYGGGGNDTLNAYNGDDVIVGGTGDDTLRGGINLSEARNGNDTYIWSRGDGNDFLADKSTSLAETDRLVLTDVTPDDVQLIRNNGSIDLYVVISSPGGSESIRVVNRFENASKGYGIETIEFADGTIWTLDDIQDKTKVIGGDGNNTLNGTSYRDIIDGGAGNDIIEGKGGDDVLIGSTGNDTLRGGTTTSQGTNGNDTYIWSRGDGNDTLVDNASSLTETDRLVLTDATSDEVQLVRDNGSNNLKVVISGPDGDETITVAKRFEAWNKGYGIEVIEFSDGTVWTLGDILDNTKVTGGDGNNTLNGTSSRDNLYGGAGNDTLNGSWNDDVLVGGTGNDTLRGGNGNIYEVNGNDTFIWSKGDGNDTLVDNASTLAETDRLVLTDVTSDEVQLVRDNGSNNLKVVISRPDGDETITVAKRFEAWNKGYGIEVIEFSDGTAWTLGDILDNTKVTGGDGNNTLNGTSSRDNLYGGAGNDTLNGSWNADVLVGGTGNDTLRGGDGNIYEVNGSDTFIWSKGDGNDTLVDNASTLAETDRLILTDVTSDEVQLVRDNGSNNLKVVISGPDGDETITVAKRFEAWNKGYGIEVIEFSNGEIWSLDDILANTQVTGGAGAETIIGTSLRDNLYGGAGDDELNGSWNGDVLVGGTGDDRLRGGDGHIYAVNGSDTFIWSRGDGNDWIIDNASSKTELDRLVLSDVTPEEVRLVRDNGSNHLKVIVSGPNGDEEITIANRYEHRDKGYGIEVIEFAGGIIWTLDDILDNTKVTGTSGNNALNGTDTRDNLFGLDGDDTLNSKAGDDVLVGGAGNDTLVGGDGSDEFVFNDGFGDDTISDFQDNTDLISIGIYGVSYNDLVITDSGADAKIEIAGHGTITVKGFDPLNLTEEDFLFI